MKNDPIEGAIARLDGVDALSAEGKKQLRKALESKFSLVTAKAARIAGDALAAELAEPLAATFARLLARGTEADKGCVALTDIARALVKLDYDDADLFRRGMRHIQMEGTWGGNVDVAAELRAVSAMGLANSRDPKKLHAMAELLADGEWPARAGAVRALAAVGSEGAALLLRYKSLLGDAEPDVLAECLAGLLAVEGAEAMELVERLAKAVDRETRETAILALGASRRADAIDWLKARFADVADAETKKCLVLALASSRTETAMDFVMQIIRTASAPVAAAAIAAMSVYRSDTRLREAVEAAAASRSDGLAMPREGRF